MPTRDLIRSATPAPDHDLWPRLQDGLGRDDHVTLRLPSIGWLEAAALGVAIGMLALVPDPLRVLAAGGLL